VIEGKKKLVIFARFLPEVHEIEKLTEKMLKKHGMKAVSIYGEIKKELRGDIVRQFQTDPSTMVFIGQIDTAGTGITLTAADTCVYYSVNFNYATYSQSLSRIHRIGQRNCCNYIHLVVENSIDSQVLEALSKKEDLAKTVVDNWQNYFKKGE
jgi:SNF2 family DNA or RNA helicase